MEPRNVALALARGRIAIGAAALAAPGLASRAMFGRDESRPATKTFARMLGGRDVALGLGVVIALGRGTPVRGWLEAGMLADSIDLAACLVARDEIPRAAFVNTVALTAGAVLIGAWLSQRLDRA